MRKKKHRILRERAGTTLVETLVSLLLMSILIGMAAVSYTHLTLPTKRIV